MSTIMLNIGNERLSATIEKLIVVSASENQSTEVFKSTNHPLAYNIDAAITDVIISKVETIGDSHIRRLGINSASMHDATGIASASSTNVIIDDSWVALNCFPLDR